MSPTETFTQGAQGHDVNFCFHLIKISSTSYFFNAIMPATKVLGISVEVTRAKPPRPHKGSTMPVPSQPKACTPRLAKYNKSQLRD